MHLVSLGVCLLCWTLCWTTGRPVISFTVAMTSAFVNLADLAKAALAPNGTVSTSQFLELCRQVLPILGAPHRGFGT